MASAENPVTFGLVHGAWHGAWCWTLLIDELQALGYKSVAMDMPIDDPTANFDNYADSVVDALEDETNLVLVGHSRAGNVLPRAAGRLDAKKLIYLCSSFEPATVGAPTAQESGSIPRRNQASFEQGIIPMGGEMTKFDKDLAKQLFFGELPEEMREWAANNMRPQRRSSNEPVLREWPAVPQEYIVCTEDRVLNPEWSRYMARNRLGIEPIEFPGNHFPFLSRPRELAKLLVSISV